MADLNTQGTPLSVRQTALKKRRMELEKAQCQTNILAGELEIAELEEKVLQKQEQLNGLRERIKQIDQDLTKFAATDKSIKS